MNEQQKLAIINSGKEYFRSIIIPNHVNKLKTLTLKDFDINPFLINYLAAFLCGNTEPESLAKALVYPRILGTSINTSFGQNIQVFISQLQQVVGGASGIDGIDIEFDKEGVHYFVSVKSGPAWSNSTSMKKQKEQFVKAVKVFNTSRKTVPTMCIEGCCYGNDNKSYNDSTHEKYCA